MVQRLAFGLALLAAVLPAGAHARVAEVTANGFVVRHVAEVPRSVDETWAVLVKPSVWWDSEHTWSGEAANLSLDARAGGCFCELLPGASPGAPARGSVEHMRVVYVERPRALRMTGALGPLQSDAVNGTLTIQLKADPATGTQVLMEYVVGGFSRTSFDKLAPAVDGVLAAQMTRFSGKLGGAFASAFATGDSGAVPAEAAPDAPSAAPVLDIVPLADDPPSSDGTIQGR